MKRLFSIVLTIIIIFSMITPTFMSNVAYGIGENNAIDLFRKTLEEDREKESIIIEKDLPEADDIVTFIVEIDEKSGLDLSEGKQLKEVAKDESIMNDIEYSQEYYIEEIKKISENAVFNNQYKLLINGFSVETRYGDKKNIEEIEGVKKVSLAQTYYRDVSNAMEIVDIPKVLDEYGYDGRGKVVAVLDSGVDYTHKDMVISPGVEVKLTKDIIEEVKMERQDKKGKYFSSKIPFGYNYADKNEDIVDRVVENIDYGHGMHVAGIIGANCQNKDEIEQYKGLKGVAPETQILAMKIFSNDPRNKGASEADIIAAIEDAVAYGADIINMSFSMTAGFQDPEEGQQKAIQAAIDEGIIVVGAAGNAAYSTYPKKNDKLFDIGTIGAPGLAKESIQVASYENSKRMTYALTARLGEKKEMIPYVLSDFDISSLESEYEVVYCGLGKKEELEGKNLTGKIALLERGVIEFQEKKLNVQEKGAIGAIIYNKEGEEEYLDYISTDPKVRIPTIFIKNSHGKKLKDMISEGLKISFNGEELEIANVNDGLMSDFTSWGVTPNLDLKPDITGIGGNVWSTVNDNGYKTMSGTSMASPQVAGIMALVLQHLDNCEVRFDSQRDKVKFAKTMLMNTAEVKVDKNENVYSPRIQGAGLVNAKKALENKSILTYNGNPSISLGEIENTTDITLELYNGSEKDYTYDLEVLGLETDTLRFESKEISIKSGQALAINGKIILDQDIDKDRFVEGFIRLVPREDDTPTIGMPFLGFYGDWGGLNILDKPIYNGGSVYNETSLYTGKQGTYGMQLYPLGGKEMNPDFFAINPEDKGANNNVLAKFSLLRNAKELKIDITDENGEILKVIEDKENLRKEIAREQQIFAKVNFDWTWDGGIYDKNLGINKIVDEGQYFINIRAKADFQGAKEQVTTFPIKIDKTVPTVKSGVFFTESDKCIIEIEAEDKGVVDSGINSFLFLLDGKKYEDENGNFIFNLTPDEDGKYRMEINLPKDKKLIHSVDIGVTDHAGNIVAKKANIIYSPKSKMKVAANKVKYNQGENILIEYGFEEGINNEQITSYEIFINSLDNSISSSKDTRYTIKRLLPKGAHKIFVKAMDEEGKVIDINYVEVVVGEGGEIGEKLIVKNITDITSLTNGEDFTAKIKAANYFQESKDVTLIVCLYDNNNRLVNSSAVEKSIDPNKAGYLTTTIEIPDNGMYKVKIFAWDNFDNMKNLLPYTEIK